LDWLTFFSDDIKSLAWPTAVVIGLVVLKRDVAALLRTLGPRLLRAKGPWGELNFGQSVDEVEDKLPPTETKAITESKDSKRIEDVSELARLPPPYIVSYAWLHLEQAIRQAVDEQLPNEPALHTRQSLSPAAYLNLVIKKGILPQEEAGVLTELRQLRNRAAHSLDPEITVTDALRYNDIVNSLIQKIQQRRSGQE
jgi:hypothetical protein